MHFSENEHKMLLSLANAVYDVRVAKKQTYIYAMDEFEKTKRTYAFADVFTYLDIRAIQQSDIFSK